MKMKVKTKDVKREPFAKHNSVSGTSFPPLNKGKIIGLWSDGVAI